AGTGTGPARAVPARVVPGRAVPARVVVAEPDADEGWSEPGDAVTREPMLIERLLTEESGATTFVTVGRLSTEKNHARLLHAFRRVHTERPDTRLIVIGEGPLRDELDRTIVELGLTGAVVMAGQQENPYAIMARADCFVLSSDYEGQPMVILEARILGLPVVSTAFGSVRGSLPDGVGLVVPTTPEGLAGGMTEFLRGAVPNPPFDAVEYNRAAIGQFYRAIGARPAEDGAVRCLGPTGIGGRLAAR
ncbi:MAG: glycosyltransferase, partial [Actinocatenispora sp.]